MDFITIRENAGFRSPIFGDGFLSTGVTYYTFTEFAQETAKRGIGIILGSGEGPDVVNLSPAHLQKRGTFRKVLLIFSGGMGDAVTVASVLPAVEKEHGIFFDICCAPAKWKDVFVPMGGGGHHVMYPPDVDTLRQYDGLITDITAWYRPQKDLRSSPVVQLCRGFGLDPQQLSPRFSVSTETASRCGLPVTNTIRIGVHLESHGAVKSYPQGNYLALLRALASLGEIYLFGVKHDAVSTLRLEGLVDLRGKTTVEEMVAWMGQMDLFLGMDSFAVHLSNLLEVPTVILLSTTAASSFQWHRHVSCLASGIRCAPCFALRDECPQGHGICEAFQHHSITPECIVNNVARKLEQVFVRKLARRHEKK